MSAAEIERLREAILDIDAHATPLGEDADGFVTGGYIISVGCLHRALGVVGHSSRPCRQCDATSTGCVRSVIEARVAGDYVREALETIAGAMGVELVGEDGPLANFQLVEAIVTWVAFHRTTCHPERIPSKDAP